MKSRISAEIINLDIRCCCSLNWYVYWIEMSQQYLFIKMTLQRYQDVHSSEIFPLLSRQFMSESRYLQPKRPLSKSFHWLKKSCKWCDGFIKEHISKSLRQTMWTSAILRCVHHTLWEKNKLLFPVHIISPVTFYCVCKIPEIPIYTPE